jgi:hypothetical protein
LAPKCADQTQRSRLCNGTAQHGDPYSIDGVTGSKQSSDDVHEIAQLRKKSIR